MTSGFVTLKRATLLQQEDADQRPGEHSQSCAPHQDSSHNQQRSSSGRFEPGAPSSPSLAATVEAADDGTDWVHGSVTVTVHVLGRGAPGLSLFSPFPGQVVLSSDTRLSYELYPAPGHVNLVQIFISRFSSGLVPACLAGELFSPARLEQYFGSI